MDYGGTMMKKAVNWISKLLYAYLLLWIVPYLIEFKEDVSFTNNILCVGIYFVLLWLLNQYWEKFRNSERKNKFFLCFLSESFLLALCIGKMLDVEGCINLKEWYQIASTLIGMPFVAMILNQIYSMLKENLKPAGNGQAISRKEIIIYVLYLTVCWGIVLLGVYPGFFVYDATDEFTQVASLTFTTHHPLFHVLYVGGLVQVGYKIFGTNNLAVFFFSSFQMFLFIAGIVYTAHKMSHFGFHKYFYRGMIILMGIFPVYPMIALCSTKDSLFALVMLLWSVTTYEWFRFPTRFSCLKWIIFSILLCQLRNNAIYALLVTGILMIIIKKGNRKAITLSFLCVMFTSTLISNTMAIVLHADNQENQEILTVPIQQLTRIYKLSRDTYSAEELQTLYKFLPEKCLNNYNPKLSDPVKIGFQNGVYEENPMEFWKLWVKMGAKAPMFYIDAWLMTSYGYWYPNTIVDVYKEKNIYKNNSYFGWKTEHPGYRDSKIPVVNEFYRKLSLEIYKEKIPVVAQLFSMGFLFWLMIFMMGFLLLTRGIHSITPYLLPLLVIATLLLGPTYLIRYVFFLWMIVPFLFADMCNTEA